MHLTLLEHGIYRQLLDTYYLSERPLTEDENELMRSHCIRNADEMQALKNVLRDFFVLTANGYHHARCDAEIARYQAKSDKAKSSANARWHGKQTKRNANAMRTHSEGNANQEPITNNQCIPHTPLHGFAEFWTAYPKKVGKGAAEKAWSKFKLDGMVDSILSALEDQKQSPNWTKDNGQYIPNPATWINQRRWEDEATNTKPTESVFRGMI